MYPETADIETSSDDYANRFSGPAGKWMLQVQERTTIKWMKSYPGATVLDVGGGHGQLAIPLSRIDHPVTVLGSDESCSRRIQKEINEKKIIFRTGNVIDLPFPDKSFDIVICIRLLPHCTRLSELIGQLCRVARNTVIVDYPAIQSINVFSASMFGIKRKLEGNTRPFTLFKHSDIAFEFNKHNFYSNRRQSEFFFPMVLHRVLNKPRISAFLEGFSKITGLTRLFGSPVLIEMSRKNE
jgi:ubiquinone/menaquinone biosynthesis C-methylase UbiE